MYAVVRTGGKQYRVSPGDILEVEKLAGDVGDSIVLEDVLMVAGDEGIEIGQPNVAGASVTARITGQHRGEKILVFRYRPKKRVRVRRGHRQYLTRLQIDKISGDGFEYGEEEKEEAPAAEIVEAVAAEAAVAAVAETSSIVEAEETVEAEVEEEADIVDRAVEAVEDTVAKAGDAVEAVGDAASEAVDAVGEVASDAVEAVSDKAGDAVEAVGDLAEDAVEAVSDAASDAVEAVGDLAEDAVDAVTKNLKGLVGRGRKDDDEADADNAEDNEKKEE
ncbi:MAG: 50S ribosomal protein L21 [Caldilineaceae bacterium]|nr:50S ribosomal protein L21 [Caldilineaceae bacterium]